MSDREASDAGLESRVQELESDNTEMEYDLAIAERERDALIESWPTLSGIVLYPHGDGTWWLETARGDRVTGCISGPYPSRRAALIGAGVLPAPPKAWPPTRVDREGIYREGHLVSDGVKVYAKKAPDPVSGPNVGPASWPPTSGNDLIGLIGKAVEYSRETDTVGGRTGDVVGVIEDKDGVELIIRGHGDPFLDRVRVDLVKPPAAN